MSNLFFFFLIYFMISTPFFFRFSFFFFGYWQNIQRNICIKIIFRETISQRSTLIVRHFETQNCNLTTQVSERDRSISVTGAPIAQVFFFFSCAHYKIDALFDFVQKFRQYPANWRPFFHERAHGQFSQQSADRSCDYKQPEKRFGHIGPVSL